MRDEFSDSVTKTVVDFATQVRETEDKFIFETIAPFCRNTLKRTISKKELEEILLRAERMKWIPCSERLPEDESYILVSFKNATMPDIARYEVDEHGNGAFYPSDCNVAYVSCGMFVNAWMPLPEPFKEEEHEQTN